MTPLQKNQFGTLDRVKFAFNFYKPLSGIVAYRGDGSLCRAPSLRKAVVGLSQLPELENSQG